MKSRLKLFITLLLIVVLTIGVLVACNDNPNTTEDGDVADNGAGDVNGSAADEVYSAVPYTRDGDGLYFGSYPQSEVTDKTLTDSLVSALSESIGWESAETTEKIYLPGQDVSVSSWKDVSVSSWKEYSKDSGVWYTDLSSDGVKYRAVYTESDGENAAILKWYKFEPLKWNIIASETVGGIETVTLLSEKTVDYSVFDVAAGYFAGSYICEWLNGSFLYTAFDAFERAVIVDGYIRDDAAENDEETYDKIYLASRSETDALAEGKQKSATAYAAERGAEDSGWWLRSVQPTPERNVMYIDGEGVVSAGSANETRGVAPVLKLRLAYEGDHNHSLESVFAAASCTESGYSEFYVCPICYGCFDKTADTGSAEAVFIPTTPEDHVISARGHALKETFVAPTYAGYGYTESVCTDPECDLCYCRNFIAPLEEGDRVDADRCPSENGKYKVYGEYPQSLVTDTDLQNQLEASVAYKELEFNDSGFGYKYKDVEFDDGETYRAVMITEYRGYPEDYAEELTNQYLNGFKKNVIYWFKWEPVMWYVDAESENALVSAYILDSAAFDDGSNAYAGSTLKAWLNDDLAGDLFGSDESGVSVALLTKADLKGEAVPKSSTDYAKAVGLGSDSWWLQNAYTDCDESVADRFVICVNPDGATEDRSGSYDYVKDYSDDSVGVVVKIFITE